MSRGPSSLKEALDIMSDLLRHGYNPAGIVREGVNVNVVRTCCRHLGISYVEEDLLRADAERRGTVYVPSPRASVETNRRTATLSEGSSMLRDDIELGESALHSTTNSPVRTGFTNSIFAQPAPGPSGSNSRKRKERETSQPEVIVISDSSEDGEIRPSSAATADKGKQVDRGQQRGGGPRGRRMVDYTDAEAGRAAPPPLRSQDAARPHNAHPPTSQRFPPGRMRAPPPGPPPPPPPAVMSFPLPGPGQKLTKGQKKARRRNLDQQIELQRQAGITFEAPPPLPPGYVRPLENAQVESAVYKLSDPEPSNRPLPSWLRNSGANSSLSALTATLPARPMPAQTSRDKPATKASSQKAAGSKPLSDKANDPPPVPTVHRAEAPSPAPVQRREPSPPPPAALPPPPPPPPPPQPPAELRNALASRHNESATAEASFASTAAAEASFQSASSQPAPSQGASLLQRIRPAPRHSVEPSPPVNSSEDSDAHMVEDMLPSDTMVASSSGNLQQPKSTEGAEREDTESEYEPTYEPDGDEELLAVPALPPVGEIGALNNGMAQGFLQHGHSQTPAVSGWPQQTGTIPTIQGQVNMAYPSLPVPGSAEPQLSKSARRRAARAQKAMKQRNSSSSSNSSYHSLATPNSAMSDYNGGDVGMGGSSLPHMGMGVHVNPAMFGMGMANTMPIGGGTAFANPQMEWVSQFAPNHNGQSAPPAMPVHNPGQAGQIVNSAVKQEPGSPPKLPPLALPTPPVANDVQGNLAKMREAALASMLGKRKKVATGAGIGITLNATTATAPPTPTDPVALPATPAANAIAPSRQRHEMDVPNQSEALEHQLDYSHEEPVTFSDSGIMLSGPSTRLSGAGRKQVSYADPFPEPTVVGAAARKGKTSGINIPSGDIDAAEAAAVSAPSTKMAEQSPSAASNSQKPKRGGRPTALDLFEGPHASADRSRAKRVRRGPFLKIPEWQQRSYGTITIADEHDGDGSGSDNGVLDENGAVSETEDADGASRQQSPVQPWKLEGEALRKHYLREVDGIVGMLRKGKTPTLALLHADEAGPSRAPLQRASSLSALQVVNAQPTAANAGDSKAMSKPGTSAPTLQIAIPRGLAASSPSIMTPAANSPTTHADAPMTAQQLQQQAEMKAKLAAHEANLKLMREQMAKIEEMRARQKAMELVKRRRAAVAASASAPGTPDPLAELANGAATPGTPAALEPAGADDDGELGASTGTKLDASASLRPAAPEASPSDMKTLELSPSPEPQDGEEWIPDDDMMLEPYAYGASVGDEPSSNQLPSHSVRPLGW
ncbi:hypothetical protein OC835_005053 [Tilletia horrida]|nr:hypothetical protein OC835_005053 [Tilletia horrida]